MQACVTLSLLAVKLRSVLCGQTGCCGSPRRRSATVHHIRRLPHIVGLCRSGFCSSVLVWNWEATNPDVCT